MECVSASNIQILIDVRKYAIYIVYHHRQVWYKNWNFRNDSNFLYNTLFYKKSMFHYFLDLQKCDTVQYETDKNIINSTVLKGSLI